MYDDYDHCYECTGYGDDYYTNDEGDLVSACPGCPFNENEEQREDWSCESN